MERLKQGQIETLYNLVQELEGVLWVDISSDKVHEGYPITTLTVVGEDSRGEDVWTNYYVLGDEEYIELTT